MRSIVRIIMIDNEKASSWSEKTAEKLQKVDAIEVYCKVNRAVKMLKKTASSGPPRRRVSQIRLFEKM